MNNIDIVSILGNISQSLSPVQHLITGFAYILGIVLFYNAIEKLKKVAESSGRSSHESMFAPIMYILLGSLLIYLPSGLEAMANTAFGSGNVLTYAPLDTTNIYSIMGLFIRTAGLIWFVRGCVLVVHASEPGTQEGVKGLLFIFAGVLATNFDNTVAAVNTLVQNLITFTMTFKAVQGY